MHDLIVNMLPLREEERDRFLQAAPAVRQVFTGDPAERDAPSWSKHLPEDVLEEATVVIGNPPVDLIRRCPNLRWLQTWSAGFEEYAAPGVLPESAMISNATGAYGQAVGEHMFAMMWALMKRLPAYAVQQTHEQWLDAGRVLSPEGGTALVIGTGDIGRHFARLARGVGMRTLGVRRQAARSLPEIDEMHGFDDLPELLPRADVVAMVVPSTPQTRHLLDREALTALSPHAIIVNAGRGAAIDTGALAEALHGGRIWGAGLDVTDPEPLPKGHALWSEPRCLITPHIAGSNHLASVSDAIIAIALENERRYVSGEKLHNARR